LFLYVTSEERFHPYLLHGGSEEAMNSARTAQAIVLEIFISEFLASAGCNVEECCLDEIE
jgi:hypothetical protein